MKFLLNCADMVSIPLDTTRFHKIFWPNPKRKVAGVKPGDLGGQVVRFPRTLWLIDWLVLNQCFWNGALLRLADNVIFLSTSYFRKLEFLQNVCRDRNENVVKFLYPDFGSMIRPQSSRFRATQSLINPLKTKRRPLYLNPQSVPRCKHFSSRL
jgi:hypothetical protein